MSTPKGTNRITIPLENILTEAEFDELLEESKRQGYMTREGDEIRPDQVNQNIVPEKDTEEYEHIFDSDRKTNS